MELRNIHNDLIAEAIIKEAPHTTFSDDIPKEFLFLTGRMVDLGFEDLPVSQKEKEAIYVAFALKSDNIPNVGVRIPETSYLMRQINQVQAAVQPVAESITELGPILPTTWKQTVLVLGFKGKPTWLGHLVNERRRSGFDLTNYADNGEAMVLFAD